MTTAAAAAGSWHASGRERSQIGVLCDADRRGRYADQYETPAGVLEVVEFDEADARAMALAVIDTATAASLELWSRIGVPALISTDLLASPGFIASLPDTLDWAALMPWSRASEVVAAADMVSKGRVGSVWQGRLSTGLGEPPHPTWETDEWWAHSSVEALYGGLLVGETLMRTRVTSTRLLARASTSSCVWHTFENGSSITQTLAPSLPSGFSWLSAELFGDTGRILVNDDFAPGNIAVWDSADRQFVFPAVPFTKPNVQAADSSKGGWDIVALFAELLAAPPEVRAEDRAQASRFVDLLVNAGF